MIDRVLQGVTDAIYQTFGDDYEIYTERVEQGLKEPCFFVYCINPSVDIFLGDRLKNSLQFAVQYIPKGPQKNSEMNNIYLRLNKAVRFINVEGNKMMAQGILADISDEILTVSFSYVFFNYEKESGDTMSEQIIKQEVI